MSPRATYLSSFTIGLLAWGGLAALVVYTKPETPLHIFAALGLLIIAIGGTTTPLWGRIQRRISSPEETGSTPKLAMRQGLWAGMFIASVLMFRFFGLDDWILILVLLILFVMLETFLQQRARWRQIKQKRKERQQAQRAGETSGQASAPTGRANYNMARTAKKKTKKRGKGKK